MRFFAIIALLYLTSCAWGSDLASTESLSEKLNKAWHSRSYEKIDKLLRSALETSGEQRPVILATGLYFYIFVSPDYEKVQTSVSELQEFTSTRCTDNERKAIEPTLLEIKSIPKSEYVKLTNEQIEPFHREFKDFFIHPLILLVVEKTVKNGAEKPRVEQGSTASEAEAGR